MPHPKNIITYSSRTLHASTYPASANVYDSLGEAYLAAEDTLRAVIHYEKSLTLDPGNRNAATVLETLKGTE